jgi:pyridoxamine 5'-phosphate oxidase
MDNSLVSSLRKSYELNELLEENVSQNPIEQFRTWFKDAIDGDVKEPNAMVLSTIKDGKPSARVVLLKGFDAEGFTFFTNYESHKGQQLGGSPYAALTFFWDGLERQVRIEGEVSKVSEGDSDAYFWSRPISSQIGAWVSKQSEEVSGRDVLEKSQAFFEEKFKNVSPIPRPPHWGGYVLKPSTIEFWQGRPSRLHDRLLYSLEENTWKITRLNP